VIYAGIVIAAPSATGAAVRPMPAAIQALHEQWSATAARNDLEGTVSFYADDAVLLPPKAPIATGRKSIRQS
jgi:ketosteroid isomerase-like protein